jgi:putative flippase GtrA
MRLWKRWGIFNLVGILGFVLQLVMLFVLERFLQFPYLLATALAVEITVLHNFAWHECLTWADVVFPIRDGALRRLIRFHFANGLISITGNVALTWMLVKTFGLPHLAANALAVVVCSLVNFVAADRFVFGWKSPGSTRGARLSKPRANGALV